MPQTPAELNPNEWSDDIRDVYALYANVRRILVALTAAGPLMEIRTSTSKKIDKNERVSHFEGTRVSEQMRMFFSLRKILTAAGVRLELPTASAPERIVEPFIPAAEHHLMPGLSGLQEDSRPEAPLNLCRKTPPLRQRDPDIIPVHELLKACVPRATAAGSRSQ